MNPDLKRVMVRNAAWIGAASVALCVLIGGSIWRLSQQRSSVHLLQAEIELKQVELARALPSGTRAPGLAAAQDTIEHWRSMTRTESLRIAELSRTARAAGVTILSLRSMNAAGRDDRIQSHSHAVRGTGSYRQLARFLDGIYASDGVVGIDQLEIRRDNDAPAAVLHASLLVTWHAPELELEGEVNG